MDTPTLGGYWLGLWQIPPNYTPSELRLEMNAGERKWPCSRRIPGILGGCLVKYGR